MTKMLPLLAAFIFTSGPLYAQDIEVGRQIYDDQCAICHGGDADGRGPTSPTLSLQPTNLTQLSATNGGVFPTIRVVYRIDGRDPLVAHGSPMPVFGEFFDGQSTALKTPAGQPILTSQPIVDLVSWLESIQQ